MHHHQSRRQAQGCALTCRAAGFAITTAPTPDLDRTNLVVGRVVAGAALVDDLAALPAVRPNAGSPFFQCAPLPLLAIPTTRCTRGLWGTHAMCCRLMWAC